MKVKKCKNKTDWNQYFNDRNQAQFLQSWQWGEFKKNLRKEVLRLQILNNNQVSSQVQGIIHKFAGSVDYIYFPRVKADDLPEEVIEFVQEETDCDFARIECTDKQLNDRYDSRAADNKQPRHTLLLKIDEKDKETLLEDMHSKTRYNIRLSDRKGVEVKQNKNIDIFYSLLKETEQRADFSGHSKDYYRKMLDLKNVHQLTAYYKNKPLASNILIHFKDTLTYLHGASTREHSDVMATYKLQWEGIKMAKDKGCTYYDFWGCSPVEKENNQDGSEYDKSFGKSWPKSHNLAGVTRFKVRFNPDPVQYPQAQNIVFSPIKYRFYKFAKKIL